MKRFNLSSPQDFMALLVRRKWWIVFPFLALSFAALLLTYMLPRMYVSEALVQIQPRDVPSDFVKDLIGGSTGQRLKSIQQTVLSRTNLFQIVNEFEDSLPEYKSLNIDQKISNLRNQVTIELSEEIVGGERLPVSFFRVSFRSRNPDVAQKILTRLIAVFLDQDIRARESNINGTTSFLTTELEKISLQLEASETKKRSLQVLYRNELPERLTANLAMLNNFVEQKKANLEALDRIVTEMANLDREINITPPAFVKPRPISTVPQASTLVQEYLKAQNDLKALAARGLTKSHPDVITVTNHLENVRKELTKSDQEFLDRKDDKSVAAPPEDETALNPSYLGLMARRATLETELKIRQAAVSNSDSEIDKYNQRIQNSPQSEQAIADVLRENASLNKQYSDMKDKVTQAQLSESLESRQQAGQFRVTDPPNLPLSPTKPAKSSIAGLGIAVSLLVGILLAVIIDIANQKMWTLSDVETLLGITVLVEIPEIVIAADLAEARRKRKINILALTLLSAAYTASLYFVYIHQGFVLRQLEPVIKRLY